MTELPTKVCPRCGNTLRLVSSVIYRDGVEQHAPYWRHGWRKYCVEATALPQGVEGDRMAKGKAVAEEG